jgi:hypothetical protein
MDERRFAVTNVSECRQEDETYWNKLRECIPRELPAFVDKLLKCKLSGFNVRAAPRTEALREQKELSLGLVESFMLHCLRRGWITNKREGWPATVDREEFRKALHEYAEQTGSKDTLSDSMVGKLLRKVSTLRDGRGEARVLVRTARRGPKGEQIYGYGFGTLPDHHKAFAQCLRTTGAELFGGDNG